MTSKRAHLVSRIVVAAILSACLAATAFAMSCSAAVKQAREDVQLNIQGGPDEQASAREDMKVQLFIAAAAAKKGNERECWRHYNVAWSYIH